MKRRTYKLKRPAFIPHPSSLILLLLLCAAPAAHALTLADYRTQVGEAENVLADLLDLYDTTEEDERAAATAQFKREETKLLGELRAALPAAGKVEWAGGALDVD